MSLKCILQGQDSKNLATKVELNEHIADKDNPHEVTAEQVGAVTTNQFTESLSSLAEQVVPKTRKINGLDLSADRTLTGENIAVSTTDSTPISGAVKFRTNPNLLDNWYFGKPVNQRGQTSYTGTGYTVDRWKIDIGGVATLEDGCICLKKSGTYLGQYFGDFDQFIGMTLTGSVLLSDGTLRTGSFVYNGVVNQEQTFFAGTDVGFYLQKLSNASTQAEINTIVDNLKIKAIKLELGDTQTLAHKENGVWILNEVPDYGEQLRRCQRYYRRWGSEQYLSIGIAAWRDTRQIEMHLPCEMRANPVLAYSGTFMLLPYYILCKISGFDNLHKDGCSIFLEPEDSTVIFQTGVAYMVETSNADAWLSLSADL